MFERFTASARGLIERARDQAERRSDLRIDVQHLLLAACDGESPRVSEVLRSHGLSSASVAKLIDETESPDATKVLGIDHDLVSAVADSTFGAGALDQAEQAMTQRRTRFGKSAAQSPLTPEAKLVLEQALQFALARKDKFICDAHVASAVLEVEDGHIASILRAANVECVSLQEELARCIIEA